MAGASLRDVFDNACEKRDEFNRRGPDGSMDYEIGVNESVSGAVVRAVSAVDGREPRSVPPLSRVLDPDALDALFDARSDGTPRIGGRLSFVYGNCRVSVDNGEYLSIRPLESHPWSSAGREPDRTGPRRRGGPRSPP